MIETNSPSSISTSMRRSTNTWPPPCGIALLDPAQLDHSLLHALIVHQAGAGVLHGHGRSDEVAQEAHDRLRHHDSCQWSGRAKSLPLRAFRLHRREAGVRLWDQGFPDMKQETADNRDECGGRSSAAPPHPRAGRNSPSQFRWQVGNGRTILQA